MADAITGNTELLATKNDLIISMVQKELQAAAKLLPTVSDFSSFAGKGVKEVRVPKLSSFTVAERTSGAAGDATALTAGADAIALDKNAYVAWVIDSFDEIQTTTNAQVEFAARAATAHGRFVDSELISGLEGVANLSINAGVPADITRDDVLAFREELMGKNANMDEVRLVVGPDMETALLKIAEFTRSDYYGSSNIPAGMIGRVYGMPVIVSNLLGTQQALCYEKSGYGIAFQQAPRMSSQGANEFGSGAERHVVDQVFGHGGLEIAQAGAAAGKSPLVAKLRD